MKRKKAWSRLTNTTRSQRTPRSLQRGIEKQELHSICHDRVGNYAEVKVKDGKVVVVCNFKKHVAPESITAQEDSPRRVNPNTYFKPREKHETRVERLENKLAEDLEKEVAKSVRTDWSPLRVTSKHP